MGLYSNKFTISNKLIFLFTLNYRAAALGWKTFEPWRQRVPFIRGLYRAGMWVGGSSVSGAITSGKNAAELILKNKR
jgi:hypothetical protein